MNLYKYSTIDKYTKTNLKNNQIYLQSPNKFNDPYEFIFKFDVNDEMYKDFLQSFHEKDNDEELIIRNMTKFEVLNFIRDNFFSVSWALLGVSCLTENENNDIMWAHYGGNHKGICIEFDKNKRPFKSFEQVEYINEIINIEFDNLSYSNIIPKNYNAALRKNIIWEYEKEWRFVCGANSFINYLPDAVKSITFGFYCDDRSKSEIYEVTSHLNIKYYEVVRSRDYYKIEKRLINGE